MTGTRKRWIKVGTVLGMVLDGVPSEKTENFLKFFENVFFFYFYPIFHQKYITLGYFWEGKKLMF